MARLSWSTIEVIRKRHREKIAISAIADALGLTWHRVWRVCHKRTYQKQQKKTMAIDSLGLRKSGGIERCPTCEEKRAVMTSTGRCVECEVAKLMREGKVVGNAKGR